MTNEEILALYDRYRAASRAITNGLLRSIGMHTMEDAARKLGLMERGAIVLDNESDAAVLGDLCIFDQRTDGESLVERLLRTDVSPIGTMEHELMEARRRARFSLFTVDRVEPGVGVHVRDLFGARTVTLVADRGMAISPRPAAIAMRLMPFAKFAMTTGAGIPIQSAEAMKAVLGALARRFADRSEAEMGELTPQEQSEFAFIVVRELLAHGQNRRVAYADRRDLPGSGAPAAGYESQLVAGEPLRAAPKAGRNDPCPCGSGKKFKRCHG